MKFYTFGEVEKPVILLLPSTCCHWKLNFGEVIPLLQNQFHVVCVSYDGFDETEDDYEFAAMTCNSVLYFNDCTQIEKFSLEGNLERLHDCLMRK